MYDFMLSTDSLTRADQAALALWADGVSSSHRGRKSLLCCRLLPILQRVLWRLLWLLVLLSSDPRVRGQSHHNFSDGASRRRG